MRLASVTSGFLILALTGASFACATGSWAEAIRPHSRLHLAQACNPHRLSSCVSTDFSREYMARSIGDHCSLRNLAQFQFVELHKFEIPTPLVCPTGKAALFVAPVILVSSIGSPETDRGPPSS